jgi:hypothetical protein
MFFEKLLEVYRTIKFPEEYSDVVKIDKTISWYLADSKNQYITIFKKTNINIVEIDIRQAFTSICQCLFDKNDDFIKQMNNIADKKSRNIFIATTLVNTKYLKLLNTISKIIVIGIIFELSNITLLELKKDGVLIICDDETLSEILDINNCQTNKLFRNFILNNNFTFHLTEYDSYLRNNRTSYFIRNNEINIKGIYKHLPSYIKTIQQEIYLNKDVDFNEIIKIYSSLYSQILIENRLTDLLNHYYFCDNKKVLNSNGVFVSNINEIDVQTYLKIFIYPMILHQKMKGF